MIPRVTLVTQANKSGELPLHRALHLLRREPKLEAIALRLLEVQPRLQARARVWARARAAVLRWWSVVLFGGADQARGAGAQVGVQVEPRPRSRWSPGLQMILLRYIVAE